MSLGAVTVGVKRRDGKADDDAMAKPDFETTWVPRIGERGVVEFRRYQRSAAIATATGLVFAVGSGIAFGGSSTINTILGVVLAIAATGSFVGYVGSQIRFAAVLSDWFGVKIKGRQLPLMDTARFDAWCEKRGFQTPEHQQAGQSAAQGGGLIPRS